MNDRTNRRGTIASAVAIVACALVPTPAADDARQIVEGAQRRTEASSQRDEGLRQVFDTKGRISDKRWIYERLVSHGQSKDVLQFTAGRRARRLHRPVPPQLARPAGDPV